jgi:bifunctional enzyme CysN/CysC
MPQEIFHLTSAGSVDDGKSTILARLLLDTGSVFEDQLGGIDPRKVDATTIADLLDGLESEREQGITIDVAHRFFDSAARRYHIADSPGHEQYTRNMATAASHANGMLLVVDARVGVKPQTRVHFDIATMLGINQFVVAVNKMDLVGYKKKAFDEIDADIQRLIGDVGLTYRVVPVSGLVGDNIVKPSRRMSWWHGETVLDVLEGFTPHAPSQEETLFSIQYVQRVPGGGRRYLGSLLGGSVNVGATLFSPRYPSRGLVVSELAYSGRSVSSRSGPAEVSLEIDSDVDLERGDVMTTAGSLRVTDQFEADVVWLDESEGFPGRTYLLRIGHKTVKSTITRLFGLDDTQQKAGVLDRIGANDIARVNIETHQKSAVSPFPDSPDLGRFVLIDPVSGNTIAAGVVNHTLRRADNLIEHGFDVSVAERSQLTGNQGRVVWFTGLSGSGKSTLANAVSVELTQHGIPHSVLDGDSLRLGLNKDLGFSESDRVENIRRTAEVAKLMADSGLVVLVSLISPYRADRESAREIVGGERFAEVFVDTPVEVCEQRDPKGLYSKARKGLIPNFTGITAPYEVPESPDLVIDHVIETQQASTLVLGKLFLFDL